MIAIAVERGEGDRRAEAVGQRNINARRSIDPSEAPRGQLNVAPEIIVRSAAGDVDRATDGVFAVERPLRSTQHLDLPDIDSIKHCSRRPRNVDAIEIYTDARINLDRKSTRLNSSH